MQECHGKEHSAGSSPKKVKEHLKKLSTLTFQGARSPVQILVPSQAVINHPGWLIRVKSPHLETTLSKGYKGQGWQTEHEGGCSIKAESTQEGNMHFPKLLKESCPELVSAKEERFTFR